MEGARFAGLNAAAYFAAVLAMNPQFPLVNAQATPPGNPAPGTPLGGGSPSGPALSLVPLGLVAVATFPPYATPRTFPAQSVIFSEVPQILATRGIGKRSLPAQFAWIEPLRVWLASMRAHNRRLGVLRKFENLLTKAWSKVRRLNRNVKCLRTRLYATTHSKQIDMVRRSSPAHATALAAKNEALDEEVNSLDDCIEEIAEPLYGFRTNVTLVEDQRCIPGQTCDASTDFDFSSRQTGEEFSSEAPPDCRVSLC